ncbi:MAG: Methyltransferase type 11 [Streptosporangiaceae bacterium]|nr:Methyltransferase type 11 [Streptosporangiaceae bacterium]
MPQRNGARAAVVADSAGTLSSDLSRLVDFTEPTAEDVCLDVTFRGGRMAEAMGSRARSVTVVDAAPQPTRRVGLPPVAVRANAGALPFRDGSFTLVTVRFALYRLPDPRLAVREMLRVCRPDGRLIIADLIRRSLGPGDRERLERLRDPGHRAIPSLSELTELLVEAGADVRRLELFTIERPAEPWLAGAGDAKAAVQIRQALAAEVEGGPPTGARPRVIGGELWFRQSLAHVAAVPSGGVASPVAAGSARRPGPPRR